MPWNAASSASFVEKEILKYVSGLEVIKSVVLDAQTPAFAMPADRNVRNVVPPGIILKQATQPGLYTKYDGSGTIRGILLHSVELIANATEGNEPVPMIWFNAVFATPAIVDFTLYASTLVTALPSCVFE